MSRNVDIVAVALLLIGIAIYAHARYVLVFEAHSHRIGFTRYTRMEIMPPPVPPPPPIPHIGIMRD